MEGIIFKLACDVCLGCLAFIAFPYDLVFQEMNSAWRKKTLLYNPSSAPEWRMVKRIAAFRIRPQYDRLAMPICRRIRKTHREWIDRFPASLLEAASAGVASRIGPNVDERIHVDRRHSSTLVSPVAVVVLDDAERIYPYIFDTERPGAHNSVLEG
jgi:hypothetical protein